ncbi:MAG: phosphopantetheine adenylyltransferase, partial [Gammaproteobacteria bacterium]
MKIITIYFSCFFFVGILLPVACLSDELNYAEKEHSILPVSNPIKDYQANINQLQIDVGPHSVQLIKPFLSMGILQNENNQLAKAEETFKHALQIHRINTGLHDLSQLPILELIINNNISQQ